MDAENDLIKVLTEQARAGDRAVATVAMLRNALERATRRGEDHIPIERLRQILDGAP
jgi:hypothetical protein